MDLFWYNYKSDMLSNVRVIENKYAAIAPFDIET